MQTSFVAMSDERRGGGVRDGGRRRDRPGARRSGILGGGLPSAGGSRSRERGQGQRHRSTRAVLDSGVLIRLRRSPILPARPPRELTRSRDRPRCDRAPGGSLAVLSRSRAGPGARNIYQASVCQQLGLSRRHERVPLMPVGKPNGFALISLPETGTTSGSSYQTFIEAQPSEGKTMKALATAQERRAFPTSRGSKRCRQCSNRES